MDQDATWYRQLAHGPGEIVLDGDPAPPIKGHSTPTFLPFLFWPNCLPSQLLLSTCFNFNKIQHGWIKMPLGVKLGLGLVHIVLDENPASPSKKRGQSPNFRLMSVLAKRLNGSRCLLVKR